MNKTSLKASCFSNRSIPLDDFPAPVTEFVLLHGTFGFLSATQNIANKHNKVRQNERMLTVRVCVWH